MYRNTWTGLPQTACSNNNTKKNKKKNKKGDGDMPTKQHVNPCTGLVHFLSKLFPSSISFQFSIHQSSPENTRINQTYTLTGCV